MKKLTTEQRAIRKQLRREYCRAWCAANPDKVKAYGDKYVTSGRNKDNARRYWRKKQGISEPTRPCPEKCELCGNASNRALHLDHDHSTGLFRGWLCSNCNLAIGLLRDSAETCIAAARYLIETRTKS